ncbi:MAG: transposase [Deltaproteobacteria bacterium]|nr:transposase [Deltaproteobacteria bacterium]
MESELSSLYCANNGRPNWSVARMLGLSILQEMHNLPDQDALHCFSFDVRWQYALGVEPEHAYLSRRSLVDFRSRIVQQDPEMSMLQSVFNRIGDAAIADLKISTDEQRLDSTRIQSNIFTCGRIDLFSKTLFKFVRWLRQNCPEKTDTLSAGIHEWFAKYDDDGWFGHNFRLTPEKKRVRLQQLAEYLYETRVTFESDDEVKGEEAYGLVCRLLDEQCEVKSTSDDTANNEDRPNDSDGGNIESSDLGDVPKSKIQVLKKVKNASTSLQSPYDPDAGYSGHKGEGYFVHVTETCNNDTREIITDYFVVHAGIDMNQDQTAIENLIKAGRQPKRLYEDGGYISSTGLLAALEKGTELVAPIAVKNQREDAICRDRFRYDEEGNCTACPAGHAPIRHGMRTSSGKPEPALHAFFDGNICSQCELGERCMVRPPNNKTGKEFHLEIDPALILKDRVKAEQSSSEWWERYKIRAGIEATMSELARVNGIKHLRVRRKPRVSLAVSLKITACNAKRWIAASEIAKRGNGEAPHPSPEGDPTRICMIFAITALCRVFCQQFALQIQEQNLRIMALMTCAHTALSAKQ